MQNFFICLPRLLFDDIPRVYSKWTEKYSCEFVHLSRSLLFLHHSNLRPIVLLKDLLVGVSWVAHQQKICTNSIAPNKRSPSSFLPTLKQNKPRLYAVCISHFRSLISIQMDPVISSFISFKIWHTKAKMICVSLRKIQQRKNLHYCTYHFSYKTQLIYKPVS